MSFREEVSKRLIMALQAKYGAHRGWRRTAAYDMDVVHNTIWNWTVAARLPGTEQLLLIHAKTGVSLDWLILGKGSPPWPADVMKN